MYSPYIGDKYFSQLKEQKFKREGNKVITERRGIYTSPPKKGKNNDAMFTNSIVQDEVAFEIMKEKANEEHEIYLNKVRER
jgi:hypothetical protein